MQLQLPFDAVLVLSKTALRTEQPDVWMRYESKTTIRYKLETGARVYTQLGLNDMRIIRDYICRWLEKQDLTRRDPELMSLHEAAQFSAAVLAAEIDRVSSDASC